MEDIKIWALDGSQVEELNLAGQTETERLLEDTLVSRPDLLLEDLVLVGRQTPTDGGPLDLLGVDGDGRLVVFELKRGTLSRDAVAQVIDYASYLDDMGLEDLANHISERSGEHGIDKIDDLQEWYDDRGFGELESLKPLRMFLVGLGVDDTTERMVRFLAENSDMDISLLTFHGFNYDGRMILAKQVEVEGSEDSDSGQTRRRRSIAELREQLNSRIESFDIRELFDDVRAVFGENWMKSSERPASHGLGIQLLNLTGSGRYIRYARIDPMDEGVRIVFDSWAANLCRDKFPPIIDEIGGVTYPQGRDPLKDSSTEIQFPLTADTWEDHKEKLTELMRVVYEAWEKQDADGGSDSS